MKKICLIKILFTGLIASAFPQVINVELVSPFTRAGSGTNWSFTATGTNSTNVSVLAGEKITVRQQHIRHGYRHSEYSGVISEATVRVRYGSSTNIFTAFWGNYSSTWPTNSLVGQTFYGPCTIIFGVWHQYTSVTNVASDYEFALETFHSLEKETVAENVTSGSSGNLVPAAAVVVPANAVGDVDVLLEQSTDMITWTQCLPGTYNASTQKRFFRVRAVEK